MKRSKSNDGITTRNVYKDYDSYVTMDIPEVQVDMYWCDYRFEYGICSNEKSQNYGNLCKGKIGCRQWTQKHENVLPKSVPVYEKRDIKSEVDKIVFIYNHNRTLLKNKDVVNKICNKIQLVSERKRLDFENALKILADSNMEKLPVCPIVIVEFINEGKVKQWIATSEYEIDKELNSAMKIILALCKKKGVYCKGTEDYGFNYFSRGGIINLNRLPFDISKYIENINNCASSMYSEIFPGQEITYDSKKWKFTSNKICYYKLKERVMATKGLYSTKGSKIRLNIVMGIILSAEYYSPSDLVYNVTEEADDYDFYCRLKHKKVRHKMHGEGVVEWVYEGRIIIRFLEGECSVKRFEYPECFLSEELEFLE